MSAFASYISKFHHSAAIADASSDYGMPEAIAKPIRQNFIQIRQRLDDKPRLDMLSKLEQKSERAFTNLTAVFQQRKQQGNIRECHGDLHLRNLAWFNDQPVAFDCIEFDSNLIFIDVINDIAFLMMDLWHQQRHDLAQVFLNQYLEVCGDYSGLKLLRFYMFYRAMVRAKIDIISATQQDMDEKESKAYLSSFDEYLNLAEKLTAASTPSLFIMFGPSGSGKSTVAQQLSRLTDAIVLRSDVERKRLYAEEVDTDRPNDYKQGIYSPQATEKTYQLLKQLSDGILSAGFSVIVDATFSRPDQRELFQRLAKQKHYDYKIIELKVSEKTMRQRIVSRENDASDANVKILQKQLENWQGLNESEQPFRLGINAEETVSDEQLQDLLN